MFAYSIFLQEALAMTDLLIGTLTQGLAYALISFGVYIT